MALDDLIAAADLDGLVRQVETLADLHAWPELLQLRAATRAAAGSLRPLWPAAVHAEHRIALEAPPPIAGPVVSEATSQFSIGPLTEVVASRCTWAEISPFLGAGPARSLVAYERVLRGEVLEGDRSIDRSIFDLPLALEDWEPEYPLATYEAARGIFPTPPLPSLIDVTLPEVDPPLIADSTASEALIELVRPWVTESNGVAEVVSVRGDTAEALVALGLTEARVGRLDTGHALQLLAWTAASGGVHGARRGMAAGRFSAWWTVAALTGLTEEWPLDPDDVADAAGDLQWLAWDFPEPVAGWSFRLAVSDPTDGLAWAIMANDVRLD